MLGEFGLMILGAILVSTVPGAAAMVLVKHFEKNSNKDQ